MQVQQGGSEARRQAAPTEHRPVPAISSPGQELTTRLAVGGKAEDCLAPGPNVESSTPLTYVHIIEQALA